MKTDKFGQQIYSESELCDIFLSNKSKKLQKVFTEHPINFSENLDLEYVPEILDYTSLNISIEEFDTVLQNQWLIPDTYKNFDIAKHILDICKTDDELQRAGYELLMFHERGMFPLLIYLKYLVDTMRQNNIVWGVGRGSSVASFVLYLLGVHKINSLYYDLDVEEFLK